MIKNLENKTRIIKEERNTQTSQVLTIENFNTLKLLFYIILLFLY